MGVGGTDMVAIQSITLRAAERLSHREATRLADLASAYTAQTIIIDVSHCMEATTPALARLVLLRRELLKRGSDVRIAGLCGQPAKLLEVHRLENVLPRINHLAGECIPKSSDPGIRPHRPIRQPFESNHIADNAGALCLQ
jgi:ABC-type transporter Mla MlaB component